MTHDAIIEINVKASAHMHETSDMNDRNTLKQNKLYPSRSLSLCRDAHRLPLSGLLP